MAHAHDADFSTPPSKEVLQDEHRKYFTFFNISIMLVAVTFVELILIILPWHNWILFTALAVLSIMKFVAVIWYFMHLKWDERALTALFILGLILGGGTLTALLLLFETGEPVPVQVIEKADH